MWQKETAAGVQGSEGVVLQTLLVFGMCRSVASSIVVCVCLDCPSEMECGKL